MAAARWWRERRFRDEVRERQDAFARVHLLLPLEEASSARPIPASPLDVCPDVGVDAGGVSSNGSAVERVSVATTDGVADIRSTSGQERA